MSLTDLIRRRPDCSTSSSSSRSHSYDDNNGGLFEFDADDPDFNPSTASNPNSSYHLAHSANCNVPQRCANFNLNMSGLRKVQTSPMTLTSLHRPKIVDHQRPTNDNTLRSERSSSLEESDNYSTASSNEVSDAATSTTDNMLTIENLRLHLNCCFSCGVSWQDEHVSLDCSECGGYSLSRPCPLCDGKCGRQWKRDLAASHTLAKANWNGVCSLNLMQKPTSQADLIIHRLHGLSTS